MDNQTNQFVYNVVLGTTLKEKEREKNKPLTEQKENLKLDDLLGDKANDLNESEREQFLRN